MGLVFYVVLSQDEAFSQLKTITVFVLQILISAEINNSISIVFKFALINAMSIF